jgi:hypothetical protein
MQTESDADQTPDNSSPKVRLAEGQEVSLGCGTLILIALIVLIFGRSKTGDLEKEIQGLRSEVVELRKALEMQTEQLRGIQSKLNATKVGE